jgi:flagellar protein FlaJ
MKTGNPLKKKAKKRISLKKDIIGFKELSLITILLGLTIFYINFMFFIDNVQVFAIMNMCAAVVTLGVPLMYKYTQYTAIKMLETIFPNFLRDVTENIRTGMTLPQAIKTCSANDYGILSPYIKDMSMKISFGIPFEHVLTDFAEKSQSVIIKRNIHTIIETHRSGGALDTVLESVVQSFIELDKIKKERTARVSSQMVNGYLIYFVFLGVMVGLSSFMVPAFRWIEGAGEMKAVFTEIFRNLIIVQGFFAGLAIGKMAEGTIMAGIKHALILVVVGYTVFVFFG